MLSIVEFTDPACPWAWGAEPVFRRLRELLAGSDPAWRRVFGILFDEDDDPPPDPAAEAAWYHAHLAEISTHTGAPVPVRLGWVARTSWPASQASVAARSQGVEVADRVLRRLRESTFIFGTPPDSRAGILSAVRGLPGLSVDRLDAELDGARDAVARDWAETRDLCPEAFAVNGSGPGSGAPKPTRTGFRYALPSLLFTGPAGRAVVSGWHPLADYLAAIARVGAVPPVAGEPSADPDEVLLRYGSLTGPELRQLAGTDGPPAGAVRIPTRGAAFWAPETYLAGDYQLQGREDD
jgi:protein-disulfide isomerase-like protein with CxxC motif